MEIFYMVHEDNGASWTEKLFDAEETVDHILKNYPVCNNDPNLFSEHARNECVRIQNFLYDRLMDIYEKIQEERDMKEPYVKEEA